MAGQHERVAPSALHLIMACNASLQLREQSAPVPESDEAAEGTAAHWVARRAVAGYGHELPVGAKFHSDGREWTVDEDMHAGAELYRRTLNAPHPEIRIEEFVSVLRIHALCGGTPDAWRLFMDARQAFDVPPSIIPYEAFNAGAIRLLRVSDYKYGHRFVEVFENPQLMAYALGIADSLRLNDLDENLFIELVLVQPRSYHKDGPVRRWVLRASDLRAFANIASRAVHAALGDNPMATTNPGCIDCSARLDCETLRRAAARLADFSGSAERTELDANGIGIELCIVDDAIQRLEARRTGLAAQAEAMLRSGKPVPMYHMEPGKSVLTYFDDVNAEELIGLGDLMGVDVRKTLQRKDLIVTPTQALQKGISPDVMKAYAQRPQAALKLARDNSVTAKKVFFK